MGKLYKHFPGLKYKIQGLSRTFQDSKKNPGLFQDVATLCNIQNVHLILNLISWTELFAFC